MFAIAVHVYLTVMDGGAWLLAIEKCFCGIQSVWIGVQFFYGQGVVNIPRAKLLRSLRRLAILLDGKLSTAEYRRLAGFLVHPWIIGMMDRALIALLFNPVTWALKAGAPLTTKVCLKRFHYLVEVFRRWHDILSADSGTSFRAAIPNAGTPAVLPPCLDIWFDARIMLAGKTGKWWSVLSATVLLCASSCLRFSLSLMLRHTLCQSATDARVLAA